jgi:ABC-2 type transport system ATP-binding protein
MVVAEHLTKYYGSTAAIRGLTFRAKKGEIFGFLGPHGAGKTTTMQILSGSIRATSGHATVADYDIASQALEVRRRVGYLPEHAPLYREMTIQRYLHFVADVKGVPYPQRIEHVGNAMAACGIHDMGWRIIGDLSQDDRQRVGLAQALLNNPPVLLLDQPTVGLQPRHMIDIRQMINDLRQRHTVILSTHSLPEARMTCDRVMVISGGQITAVDTPDNLTQQARHHCLLYLDVQGPQDRIHTHLQGIKGVVSVAREGPDSDAISCYTLVALKDRDLRAHIAQSIIQQGWQLLELRLQRLRLEEVFAQLVTEEEGVNA